MLLCENSLSEFKSSPIWVSEHSSGDDLCSAGLGRKGLQSPYAPGFENPEKPSVEELRRRAIYENYRALVDTSRDGGYGIHFGLASRKGLPKAVPGREFRTLGMDDCQHILQLPHSFKTEAARLLVLPSSSSRGVYGAIPIAEWGLRRGYAVVLCDKGTGNGFQELSSGDSPGVDGLLRDGDALSKGCFQVPDEKTTLKNFCRDFPHRVAFKHAHSGSNVESRWGQYVLESTEFALHVLKQLFGLKKDQVVVVASGLSNGAGSSLRAAELDEKGLIDALAVAEPNVTPEFDDSFVIEYGNNQVLTRHSQSLLNYASKLNLYAPVATLGSGFQDMPFNTADESKLRLLQKAGLWKGLGPEEASRRAQQELREAGLLTDSNPLLPSHVLWGLYESIGFNLTNCYGEFHASDHFLGVSIAAVDAEKAEARALTRAEKAQLYALSNGICPTACLQLVSQRENTEVALDMHAIAFGESPQGVADRELDKPSSRVHKGLQKCLATGRLRRKPTIIVNGRCDSILAPNHSSRSYLGKHLTVDKSSASLSYWEVEHAHHLDALNAFPNFKTRFVPLLPYLFRALEKIERILNKKSELPPSQVVRSRPRQEGERLTDHHIPHPTQQPRTEDLISWSPGLLKIPE